MSRSSRLFESPVVPDAVSPASMQHGNNSPLTPRSKIKAMLAAIDDDSDPDASFRPNGSQPQPAPAPIPVQTPGRDSDSPKSDYSSGEDAFHGLPAPRGRVAACLKTQAEPSHESSGNDNNNAGDTYFRLKKGLAGRSTNPPVDKEKSPSMTGACSSTDEDDILPAVTRRIKKRPLLPPLDHSRPKFRSKPRNDRPPACFLPLERNRSHALHLHRWT